MKKILLISFIVFACFEIKAQEIEVVSVYEKMDKGKKPGMKVDIPEVERTDVEKAWKKRLKDFDNDDVDRSRKSVFGDNILIESISENTVDVYTQFSEHDGGTQMIVFFDLGGVFLKQEDDNYGEAVSLVRTFAVNLATEGLEEQLDEQTDILEDHQDDLEDLKDDKEDMKDDIEDLKEEIKELEKAIEKNVEEQEKKQEIIEGRKEIIEEMEDKIKNLD